MKRFSTSVAAWLIATTMVLTSCASGPWRKADDFVASLQCGISEANIGKIAEHFSELRIERPPDAEDKLVAQKGNTVIQLWFDERGLVSQQITWTYPWTRFSARQKVDLCTGERTIVVRVIAPPSWANAAVLLDGEQVAILSAQGTVGLELGLGEHRLSIEDSSSRRRTRKLAYDVGSPGYDRVVFNDEVENAPSGSTGKG